MNKLCKYIFYFILSASFFFLALMEAHQAILFSIILIGFMLIILKNNKYKYLLKSIERFF